MNVIEFLQQHDFIVKLLMAVLELGAGFVLAPIIRKWIMSMKTTKGMDQGVLTFSASAASIMVKFLAIVIALGQIGVNLDVIVGAFSAIGLGISLAMKESMANVAGGLQILMTKPFKVGDFIGMEGNEGTVKEIQLMFTTLQTANGQEIVLPNSNLVSNTIVNYSEFPVRRIIIEVPASVSGDYASFRTRMVELMNTDTRILKDPAPSTVISGFTPDGSGMNIRLVCYVKNPDYWATLFALNEQVQLERTALKLLPPVRLVQVDS